MFKKLLRSQATACAVTAVIAVTAVGVGSALASTDSNAIYACKDQHGNLRAVDGSADCKKNETPLEWNVEGPAGAQGVAGPQGPQGVAGPQGPQGLPGADGVVRSAITMGSNAFAPGAQEWRFLAPTAIVSVEPGQRVHVWSNRTIGSSLVGGGREFSVNICVQNISGGPVSNAGANTQLAVPQGTLLPVTLHTILPTYLDGAYRVGLCGWAPSTEVAGSWNRGGGGATQVMVTNA